MGESIAFAYQTMILNLSLLLYVSQVGNETLLQQEDIASQQNGENDGSRHTMDDQENGRPQDERGREGAKSSLATQVSRIFHDIPNVSFFIF